MPDRDRLDRNDPEPSAGLAPDALFGAAGNANKILAHARQLVSEGMSTVDAVDAAMRASEWQQIATVAFVALVAAVDSDRQSLENPQARQN